MSEKNPMQKVVDKQSLYKNFYSLLQFELIVLAGAGGIWLLSSLLHIDGLICVWVAFGLGHVIVIFSFITALREYSESLVIKKMREKSANAEQGIHEVTVKQQEVRAEQSGGIPEFRIAATSALDLPKLSTDAQKTFDSLSLFIKKEYMLWSTNLWSLFAACIIFALYDFGTILWFGILEVCLLIPISLFLSAHGRDDTRISQSIPAYLTRHEPRKLKLALIVYIFCRAIIGIIFGYSSPTFTVVVISFVLVISLYVNIRLYSLKRNNEIQAFPKVSVLALWVFGSQNIWTLLEFLITPIWKKLGNIYLIRGGKHILKQVSLLDSLFLLGGRDSIISKTPADITHKLTEFKQKSTTSHEYHFNTLICGDNSWQFALHSLIDETDLIFMHLSDFSTSNQGCIYELEQLINRVPAENFFLLVDRHSTDYDFLQKKLLELWNRMKIDSPNQRAQASGIQIIFLEHAIKAPAEVEAIYADMNSAQQNALDVLQSDPRKKELVLEYETRKKLEMEGLFRVLFERAVQLGA